MWRGAGQTLASAGQTLAEAGANRWPLTAAGNRAIYPLPNCR